MYVYILCTCKIYKESERLHLPACSHLMFSQQSVPGQAEVRDFVGGKHPVIWAITHCVLWCLVTGSQYCKKSWDSNPLQHGCRHPERYVTSPPIACPFLIFFACYVPQFLPYQVSSFLMQQCQYILSRKKNHMEYIFPRPAYIQP